MVQKKYHGDQNIQAEVSEHRRHGRFSKRTQSVCVGLRKAGQGGQADPGRGRHGRGRASSGRLPGGGRLARHRAHPGTGRADFTLRKKRHPRLRFRRGRATSRQASRADSAERRDLGESFGNHRHQRSGRLF